MCNFFCEVPFGYVRDRESFRSPVDEMLDARLTSAFGTGRAKSSGSGSGGPSNTYSDFGWILKKKKIKIGREGPTIARKAQRFSRRPEAERGEEDAREEESGALNTFVFKCITV